jgi:hypothetical protein
MATRYPSDVSELRAQLGFTSSNVYTTTNPKTLKNGKVSEAPTLVLHLEPVTGGVCPAAGSCAALCLHKAGNPLYTDAKVGRRRIRSAAYLNHRPAFLRLLVADAARYRAKGYVAMRLNGTSDIAWEWESVALDPHLISYVSRRLPQFRIKSPGTYTMVQVMGAMGFQLYDYTKRIDRDWMTCAAHGYHLTLSWGGKHDDQIFAVAERHGLNVAAPIYGVGRKAALPAQIERGGVSYPVIDGDVTDARWGDPAGRVHVVGLRLKRTPGQTERLARAFCIA